MPSRAAIEADLTARAKSLNVEKRYVFERLLDERASSITFKRASEQALAKALMGSLGVQSPSPYIPP